MLMVTQMVKMSLAVVVVNVLRAPVVIRLTDHISPALLFVARPSVLVIRPKLVPERAPLVRLMRWPQILRFVLIRVAAPRLQPRGHALLLIIHKNVVQARAYVMAL